MITTAARDPLIDTLKGFAIFLVVWGHAIQCMGEDLAIFTQPIGKFIYLFHMPMFFFLSGYVSVNALSRKFGELFKSRIRSLFIPMCIWALIGLIIKVSLGIHEFSSAFSVIRRIILEIYTAYWFIWALLFSIFYAWIARSLSRTHKTLFLIASALLLLFIPTVPYLGGDTYKCMYPFFIGGYLFHQYGIFDRMWKHVSWNLIAWGGVFLLCFMVCKKSYFMYFLDINLYTQGAAYIGFHMLFLLAAGFSGTILSYFGMKYLMRYFSFRWLSDIGSYTFAIYMIQSVLFNMVLVAYPVDLQYQILYFLAAAVITYVIWKLAELLSHSKILSVLLLGKTPSKKRVVTN